MPPPRRPHARPGRTGAAQALAAVALLASRWIERLLAQHGPPLTVSQYLALRAIARDDVSGTELARRSGVSGPAVSQLLAALADAGLVERQLHEHDRRRSHLHLSPAGTAALAAAEALLSERLASLLGDLSQPDAAALTRLLTRVELALSSEHPPRRPAPPRPASPPPAPPRAHGRR